jgi:predicted molibdopterin-dependent oxidoreductase YjgC
MDYRFVTTTCPFCGCVCQMRLEVMDGRLIGTIPLKTAPMNQGKLCIKGWNAHEFVHSPDRLTAPLIRKNGKLAEASWEEALEFTASRLTEIKSEHGGDSIGFFASARCTRRRQLPAGGWATTMINLGWKQCSEL